MRIQLLPPNLVDQIAAGEVIERPASVVKELVENSLDAGATRIEIDLQDGGKQGIRIRDDGAGIEREDLPLAFASHATSKIRNMDDLFQVATLGFRGEALASIGSVARASILSRTKDAALGGAIENEGGRVGPVREAGAPLGTTMEVRDLFFNLPARRKFLKAASTELGHIVDVVLRVAIPFEGVDFTVRHEDRLVLRIPGDLDLRERIRAAFGKETAESLLAVEATSELGKIHGYLGLPRISRGDASRQFLYLNGRFIRDRALSRALREAYRELLPHGRQPVAFLFLGIDPNAVDQNVHPTKIEVRFREGRELFGFFLRSLREALERANLATPGATLTPQAPSFSLPASVRPVSYGEPFREATSVRETTLAPSFFSSHEETAAFPLPARAVGPYLQIHDTYLIRQTPEGFEVVDQHALHERVLFEEFKSQFAGNGVPMQRLLVPETVEVSRAEVFLVQEKAEELRKAGFEIEPFGETTLAVHGVPARLRRIEGKEIVAEILALAREENDTAKHGFLEEVLHRAACRAAVMAGDTLAEEEIAALLQNAAMLSHDQTCPHSRPTRVKFTLQELERAFQRR